MIVELTENCGVNLAQAADFRNFAPRLPSARSLAEVTLDASLFPTGSVEDEAHVWLDVAALKALGPGGAAWGAGFDAMIAYAARHGWTRHEASEVRVHVTRAEHECRHRG
jgi:hypothetical protein